MNPDDRRYTQEHEWVRIDGELATVGTTHHAQHQLGDVVFVDLPEVGVTLNQHQPFGSIDSVKTASDLFSPISGEVVEVNGAVIDDPAVVNADPFGQGWMLRVRPSDPAEADTLMTADQYSLYMQEA